MRSLILILPIAIVVLLAVGPLALADEHQERQVDRAALAAQWQAVKKFEALAKRYQGNFREPILLMRLVEVIQQAADLEFRIAHGAAARGGQANLTKYFNSQRDLVSYATRVIERYPRTEGIERMYTARALANVELKQLAAAKLDYGYLSAHFPGTPWAVRADLALADFATTAHDYRQAIGYLKKVEALPHDNHYPQALYQLAWAYFNLSDIPTAISYLRINIEYYRRRQKEEKKIGASDRALWEHSLRDVVTFYFSGYEKKLSGYSIREALPLFRDQEKGDYLGKMLTLFAKELRSHDRADDLNEWKNRILKEETDRPEALEVAMVNYEYLAERRLYDKMLTAARDFVWLDHKTDRAMRKMETYPAAQALILHTANSVQKLIASETRPAEAQRLSGILASIYAAFAAIVDESNPQLTQIHYNLAEILFRVKDYDGATREYVWVLEHWQDQTKLNRADIRLKAIGSRYQLFLTKSALPKDLTPAALNGGEEPDLGDLDKSLHEWIEWVDAYVKDFGYATPAVEAFVFETNRILYAHGQTNAAIGRLLRFVTARPQSKQATASASLVLDTYLFNQQWQKTFELAEGFIKIPNLGDAEFRKRLNGLPGEAFFKTVELTYQAKDYAKTLEMAGQFLQRYPSAAHVSDCLFLSARAAMEMHDTVRAGAYLSELLRRFPRNDNRLLALLARGGIEDANYDFDGAASDYREYLASGGTKIKAEERRDLTRRLFLLTWLSRRPVALDCRRFAEGDELMVECERYQSLISLQLGSTEADGAELVRRATKGTKENRPLWAAVGLQVGRKIGVRDRLTLATVLAGGWKSQDALLQFALIPILNRALPEAFQSARRELARLAPLKADSKALSRRINLIRDLENSAGKVVDLPWAQVKVAVLGEVAQSYLDFSDELARLPAPKDLTGDDLAAYQKSVAEILDPFREKGKTLKKQTVEMAAGSAIDASQVAVLAEAGGRRPASRAVPTPIDLTLLDRAWPAARWSTAVLAGAQGSATSGQKPEDQLRALWADAVKARSLGRQTYFFQEYKEKVDPKDAVLALMRAVSLAQAGAQAEALAELESARSDLRGPQKQAVTQVLFAQYSASSAPKKAKAFETRPEGQ